MELVTISQGGEVMYNTAFVSIIALILFIEADIEEPCKYEPDTHGSLPLIAFGTSPRGPNGGQVNILLRRKAGKKTLSSPGCIRTSYYLPNHLNIPNVCDLYSASRVYPVGPCMPPARSDSGGHSAPNPYICASSNLPPSTPYNTPNSDTFSQTWTSLNH